MKAEEKENKEEGSSKDINANLGSKQEGEESLQSKKHKESEKSGGGADKKKSKKKKQVGVADDGQREIKVPVKDKEATELAKSKKEAIQIKILLTQDILKLILRLDEPKD